MKRKVSIFAASKKKEVKRLLLHIMRCFLPVLFITYMASITFFAHAHVVNGVTIVHSHPFKKGAAHSHSTIEFLLIHSLSNLATGGLIGLLSLFLFFPFLLCLLVRFPNYACLQAPYHGVASLRAPPVVRFS